MNAHQLNKAEMKTIFGGLVPAEFINEDAQCSATCLDAQGNEYIVTCSGGSSCTSSDYNGCESGSDRKRCPDHY